MIDELFNKYELYEKFIGCSCVEHARRQKNSKENYIFNIENEICIKGRDTDELKLEYLIKFGEKYKNMSSCERYRFLKNYYDKKSIK